MRGLLLSTFLTVICVAPFAASAEPQACLAVMPGAASLSSEGVLGIRTAFSRHIPESMSEFKTQYFSEFRVQTTEECFYPQITSMMRVACEDFLGSSFESSSAKRCEPYTARINTLSRENRALRRRLRAVSAAR